jgi:hypothetical protein
MFGREKTRVAVRRTKLHSISAVMREVGFEGSFTAEGIPYSFTYSPRKAAIVSAGSLNDRPRPRGSSPRPGGVPETRLRLNGSLLVIDSRPFARVPSHNLSNVRADLIATQGGIGAAPPRKKLPPDISPPGADLPVVESTGALSFCGVLYFKLAPLEGSSLGVRADMSSVQLNARLAPRNDRERELQAAYSSIADALYGKETNVAAAETALGELNILLARR